MTNSKKTKALPKQEEISKPYAALEQEQQVVKILDSLPKADRAVLLAAIKQESFSGPLPHPQYFEGYEKVLQGSANRILNMTEEQVKHRLTQESRIVKRSLNQKLFGMIIGGLLTILILGAVVYLGLKGHDVLAGTIGTTTIIGVITVFVLGVRPGAREKVEDK